MRNQWLRAGSLAGCLIVACGCSGATRDSAEESARPPPAPGSEVHGAPAPAITPAPAGTAAAAEKVESMTANATAPASATSPARTEPAEDDAAYAPIVQRAREALIAAKVTGAADARATSVAPHEWSDSSLGCRRKGESYLQMITSGHVVTFDIGGVPTVVNVAGDAAVYCGQGGGDVRPPKRPNYPVRAETLQKAVTQAREDLAAKLGVPVDEIKVVATVPFIWEDGNFRCGSAADAAQRVRGYKLQLTRGMDSYTYHTDFKSTFACPAVETE